jgi:hypothetical protein
MVKLATTTPDGRAVSINMKRAERKMQQQTAAESSRPAAADAYTDNSTYGGAGDPAGQTAQISEEPIVREPVQQTADYDMYEDEIDAIWAEIIEDGESQTDTFTLVRTGAVPIKMNDTEFVIKVSGLAGRYLEKNRVPMENLIAKYAGGPHKMILRSEDEESEEDDLAAVADRASQLLGTKVEIR